MNEISVLLRRKKLFPIYDPSSQHLLEYTLEKLVLLTNIVQDSHEHAEVPQDDGAWTRQKITWRKFSPWILQGSTQIIRSGSWERSLLNSPLHGITDMLNNVNVWGVAIML